MKPARTWDFFWKKNMQPYLLGWLQVCGKVGRSKLPRQASHDFGEGTYWRIKDLRIYDLNWKPQLGVHQQKGGGGLGGDGGDGGFGQKFWGQVCF